MFDKYLAIMINTALLFSIGSIYILLPFKRKNNSKTLLFLAGIMGSIVVIIIMNAQFPITEGFLLDTRSVLLSVTAAFLGVIPATMAAIFASALRIYQGGNGAFTGVLVIVTTTMVGLLFRRYRLDKLSLGGFKVWVELYLLGVVTHIVMVFCFYTLPFDVANFVLGKIFWPVMLIFPLITVPLGFILLIQRRNVQNAQKIEYISDHDYLTNLYNRYYLENQVLALDVRSKYPLCVMMGDVNGLKLINDSFGHLVGDELLVMISEILVNSTRSTDVVARWGGDEFIILLPNTTLLEGNEIAIKIKEACNNVKLMDVSPSISIGYSIKDSMDTKFDDILSEAEELMYRNKLSEGRSVRSSLIETLENTLIERKYESEHHAKHMKQYGERFGNELGLSQTKIDEIGLIARLHDIGKIGISEVILLKKGKLSSDEYEEIKKHPQIGFRILNSIKELEHVSKGVLYHHEKWDGTGYPMGLTGEEIPIESRITSILDAFEVMICGRPYQLPKTTEEALQELLDCSGTQFDPTLVKAFLKLF